VGTLFVVEEDKGRVGGIHQEHPRDVEHHENPSYDVFCS
jgi:hypothetical protein